MIVILLHIHKSPEVTAATSDTCRVCRRDHRAADERQDKKEIKLEFVKKGEETGELGQARTRTSPKFTRQRPGDVRGGYQKGGTQKRPVGGWSVGHAGFLEGNFFFLFGVSSRTG